jgi:hypothetical protein
MAEPRYIDLTPTFAEATAICIAVIENCSAQAAAGGGSMQLSKAAEDCKKELLRYAGILDNMKEENANG